MLRYIESSKLPTRWGTFDIHGFEDPFKGKEHIAITMGGTAVLMILCCLEFIPNALPVMPWAVCAVIAASSCMRR